MQNIPEKIRPSANPFVAFIVLALSLTGCSRAPLESPSHPQPQETIAAEASKQLPVAANEDLVNPDSPAEQIPRDLWQRIRDGYGLDSFEHPRIDSSVAWFNSHKSVIQKSSQRATPLLYYIVKAIEAKGLPAELALIPLLETGYRVHAQSPLGALGPWQFMPATGRQYGLSRTPYLDQRRDLVLSTEAGLAYLSHLHRQFDQDWLLAIAAYNAGPGTLKKALGGERKTFWEIVDRLPKETQTYVPKLLAASRIIGTPSAYGVKLHSIVNEPHFETIKVNGPVDFEVLNDLRDWDEKTFRRLNGALSSTFYGREQSIAIRVPKGRAEKVSAHLTAVGPPPERKSFKYLVERGDTLGALAIRFDVPIRELRRYNGLHRNNIRAGKEILIPNRDNKFATSKLEINDAEYRHIVKPGDSFWTLGRRFAVSARTLARHNGHAINKTLFPGQLLVIPTGKSANKLTRTFSDLAYIVKHGDSFWSIARRLGVATAELKSWNPLIKHNLLRPGQKLLVQVP